MTAIDTEEIERRLELARRRREDELAFFRSLLDAKVFSHARLSDDQPRVRFIQFQHPAGFYALPIFTSEAKALVAARGDARIVSLTGRELLERTRGATLMLNPNDGGCVLYPEEIAALLNDGTVARIEHFELGDPNWMHVQPEVIAPCWLAPAVVTVVRKLHMVKSAYLLQVSPGTAPAHAVLLLALGVRCESAEHAARAAITALQPLCALHRVGLDLMTFDPEILPNYLRQIGVIRLFDSDTPSPER